MVRRENAIIIGVGLVLGLALLAGVLFVTSGCERVRHKPVYLFSPPDTVIVHDTLRVPSPCWPPGRCR